MPTNEDPIVALLISPNREIAEAFLTAAAPARYFQIVADLRSYLPEHVLEMRLRQWRPDVVLLDLSTDIDEACETIRFLMNRNPAVQVVALHSHQHGDAVIRSLRAGASEFLSAPFDPEAQRTAFDRVVKLRPPVFQEDREPGKVIAFASAKPGAGASTLAAQSAFAIQRLSGKRVLLIDLDLLGGTIGFYLSIHHRYSCVDLFDRDDAPCADDWSKLTAHTEGVDILPGPDEPYAAPLDPGRLQLGLDMARRHYDYIVLDLPSIFHRTALLAVTESNAACLVTTPELPSLHLARKATAMLDTLGFARSRYSVVVNRMSGKEDLTLADVGKMLKADVGGSIPNDYFSLHRCVARGTPLKPDVELGSAIESFAGKIAGLPVAARQKARSGWSLKPMLS